MDKTLKLLRIKDVLAWLQFSDSVCQNTEALSSMHWMEALKKAWTISMTGRWDVSNINKNWERNRNKYISGRNYENKLSTSFVIFLESMLMTTCWDKLQFWTMASKISHQQILPSCNRNVAQLLSRYIERSMLSSIFQGNMMLCLKLLIDILRCSGSHWYS